jgi:beta-lysine 5,6-aminomutase alpha subunit
MSQLFVEPEKIARARELARTAARGVQAFIERHTTVAIERTVLRLLGISGAGTRGAPLANLMVDRLRDAKVLHKGAAWWLGRALKTGKEPLQAIERITAHPEKLPELSAEEDAQLREEMRGEARSAVRELKARIDARKELKASLKVSPAPWKYVIVATGNIYDDVEQAKAAAQLGADVIAVIRSTAQSLLDYVPHGATTEGYGGTYATQENFRIMREALDAESKKLGRYVHLTNYSSGLCMPEIAFMAAYERLDMLLNDAMYGILFRDINMKRTFCDQYFSRRICGFAGIIINTGEDNYITTADADEAAHTVIASQLINETFATLAGMPHELIGFGHSFEIDPAREDTLLREFAMAMMVRELFPKSPIKYMPPTKHKEGDIFFSHAYDVMADLVAITTGQGIQLLGMMTEAMHNPFLMDRFVALKSSAYVYRAARHLGGEISFKSDGIVARRQREVFDQALHLLEETAADGMMAAIGKARFGDTARTPEGGKGLDGVVERGADYFNPFLEILEGR